MSKSSSLSRSISESHVSASDSLVESSSQETPALDKQSKSLSPPVMKTKTKKSAQREVYKANASSSTSYTQKNRDIGKSFKTEIETARQNNEIKQQWTKFTDCINQNGVLPLFGLKSEEILDLADWLSSSASAKVTGLRLICEDDALSQMDYKAAKSLATIIQTNTSITYLMIMNSNIDDQTAQYFAKAIKANPKTKIATLDLRSNEIGPDGAKDFAEALKTNTTITKLDFSYNNIGPDGAKVFAEMLKTNTTITTLNFSSNGIGPEGAKFFPEMLETNTTITTLNLSANHMKDEGTKALAEALKTNTTITTLDISHNNIGPDGAKDFAEMLKTNTTIITLDLSNNRINDEGANAFAETLRINTTIKMLNLKQNSIVTQGAKALAKSLESNTTITRIELDFMYIDKYTETVFIIDLRCELNEQKAQIENNIAGALDLLTHAQNKHKVNITSVPEVNNLIAQKIFVLDKAEKLNTTDVTNDPNSVFNKYT